MLENEYLSYSEQLTAFLDGELDSAESGDLFYKISQSPELQQDMRILAGVKNATKNSLIVPPANLKAAVMANAGFGVVPNKRVGTGFFLNKYTMSIFSAVGAFILAWFLLPNKTIDRILTKTETITQIVKEPVYLAARTSSFSKDLPVSRNISELNENQNNSISDGNSIAEFVDEDAYITVYDMPSIAMSNNVNSRNFKYSNNLRRNYQKFNYNYNELSNFMNDFSLSMRGLSAMSFPNPDVSPLTNPLINNYSLSLMYDAAPHFQVGVEIGQEDFLQEFHGTENHIPVTWKQNYLGFWAGAAIQYNMNPSSLFTPYARIFAGGTKVGPVLKATAGASYALSDRLSAFAGVENTGLFYLYQNNLFATYKLGVTGGFTIRF